MAAKIDLDKYSIKDLMALRSDIDQSIAARREQERSDLKRKMAKMVEDAGFTSIEDVIGRQKAKKGASVAKYRNPADASQTWTGRGRKPQWLIDRLEKGEAQERFLIA